MRLSELNPQWIDGQTRRGVGLMFDCPSGCEHHDVGVYFANSLDGGPTVATNGGWQRIGDTFEEITLTPSIQSYKHSDKCWHGYITNGEIITV